MERLARGPKGEQGTQGERGERGLSWRVTRAIVVLFVIPVALAVFGLFWINHAVAVSAAATQRVIEAQQKQAAAEQAAQARQAELLDRKLCATLDPLAGLAELKPPAGNAKDNPSRAYEQELSAKLAPLSQLGPDLGCAVKP
jgi:hypothetical protein